MRPSSILLLFLLCGTFTSFAAKTLIGYTNESEVERSLRETAEEEFKPQESKHLRIEQRIIETTEEEFNPFKSDSVKGDSVFASRPKTKSETKLEFHRW